MPRFIDFGAVKARFDLSDALARFGYLDHMVELDNGQLKGPCPIHSHEFEGVSFKVTPSRKGFRCFGCAARGNVLDLVAAVEHVTVHQAAIRIDEWLAGEPAVRSQGDGTPSTYQAHLFAGLPIYSARLVRETTFDSDDFAQCRSPDALFDILRPYFLDRDREECVVVLLDNTVKVIGLVVVSVGSLNAAIVEPAQVFKPAILANAASVIVAHNHPSGSCEPSREDIVITNKLVDAGKILGIPVRDHLIITDRRYSSLVERGVMDAVT